MNEEEVARKLQGLQESLNRIGDDALKRMASEMADARIAAWEKRRLSVIVVVLAVFGIASYASLTDKVANYFADSVKPRIAEEVKKKTASVSTQDPAISEIRTELKDLSRNVAGLSKALTDTTKLKPPAQVRISEPAVGGYAFFGIRDASGQWSERYFSIEGEGDRPPKPGDRLRATGSVNIRQGYIVFTDAGWVNKPSIGVLRRDDVVRVSEVREVVSGFWWISFTPERQP